MSLNKTLHVDPERRIAQLEAQLDRQLTHACALDDHIEKRDAENKRLREAVDYFLTQIDECDHEHGVCRQLTILAEAVRENLAAVQEDSDE